MFGASRVGDSFISQALTAISIIISIGISMSTSISMAISISMVGWCLQGWSFIYKSISVCFEHEYDYKYGHKYKHEYKYKHSWLVLPEMVCHI